MYRDIKMIEIKLNSIAFQNVWDDDVVECNAGHDFDFSKKSANTQCTYDCDNGLCVVIDKMFLYVYDNKNNDELLLSFYIPFAVRFYIEKDIRIKGAFTLEYRKHLYDEYDRRKHVLIKMNFADGGVILDQIKLIAEQYSTGVNNQPIIVCYMDKATNSIHYAIIKESIVVESGVTKIKSNNIRKLPNIFQGNCSGA